MKWVNLSPDRDYWGVLVNMA
jgi:hypothetical protein